MRHATNNFEVAKRLHALGCGLLPLKEDKAPMGPWKDQQTNPKSPEQMQKANNYGLVCGYNDVEILDLDYKVLNGEEEIQIYDKEVQRFLNDNIENVTKKLAVYETVSGGLHLIYMTTQKEGNKILAKLDNEKTLFETRGVGGYGFLYPESHLWGNTYESLEYITKGERDLLFSFFKSFDRSKMTSSNMEQGYTKGMSFSSLELINRYNAEHKVTDVVGEDFKVVRNSDIGQVILRNGDTKSKSSGYIFKDSGGMYLFSTSTIYPAETYISPFTANIYKNHNGNFKEAYKDLVRTSESSVRKLLQRENNSNSSLSNLEIKALAKEMKSENYTVEDLLSYSNNSSLSEEDLKEFWYSDHSEVDSKVIVHELNEKLTKKNSFELANFKGKPINFSTYREYLGSVLSIIPICGLAVKKNPDGTSDFSNIKNIDDLYLDLIDSGMKLTDNNFKKMMNSDSIPKLDPLTILLNQLQQTPWDNKDRINDLVLSANLKGDFETNLLLLKKFFCTVYNFALRGLDPSIPEDCDSRVVVILVHEEKGSGKSTFWRKIGLEGLVKKTTGISGTEFYSECQGELPKDERQFKSEQSYNLLYQFDDMTDVMIKSNGALRSLISSKEISVRLLYQNISQTIPRRASFCGSSNHRELIKDSTENRFLIFELAGVMNFDLFNSIDKFQFWAQIRNIVIQEQEKVHFNLEDLKLINELAQEFVYHSELENSLSILLRHDPIGNLTFSGIKIAMKERGFNSISDNQLSKALLELIPKSGKLKRKINGSFYYYLSYKDLRE